MFGAVAPVAAAAPLRAADLRLPRPVGARLVLEQRLAVGIGDLVIVGMDFREGKEAVPVAAVVDEGGLQRRLDARDLGEIDIAAKLFA